MHSFPYPKKKRTVETSFEGFYVRRRRGEEKKKGEGGFILSLEEVLSGGIEHRQSQNGQILLNCIMFMYMTQLPASISRTLYRACSFQGFSCQPADILPVTTYSRAHGTKHPLHNERWIGFRVCLNLVFYCTVRNSTV